MKNRKKTVFKLTKNKRKSQHYYIQNSNFSRDNENKICLLYKTTYTIPFNDVLKMNSFKSKFYHLLNEKQVTEKSYNGNAEVTVISLLHSPSSAISASLRENFRKNFKK